MVDGSIFYGRSLDSLLDVENYQLLLVDTLGLVLMVIVSAANISDQRSAKVLLRKTRRRGASTGRLIRVWADAGYQRQAFMEWMMGCFCYIWGGNE